MTDVPPPPPGPGVQPPFAAPPAEGRTTRVWLGLGVAGLAALLCCGGGLASLAGLLITGNAALNEQAHSAVADYLQALGAGKYADAYQLLCDDLRDEQTLGEFTAGVADAPKVTEYELRQTRLQSDGDTVVPADLRYDDGSHRELTYLVVRDGDRIKVCGTTG